MVLYLAIFTIMSIAVINSFIIVMSSFRNTVTNRNIMESGVTAMERISREIRQAKSIDTFNSALASSPGILQLNSTDTSGTDQVIKFSVSSGAINLYKDGLLVANLLDPNISVTNLVFRRITNASGNGEAVKIEMTLQDTKSKNLVSKNFYNTIIVRNEY